MMAIARGRISWLTLFWLATLPAHLAHAQTALNSGDAIVEKREAKAWLSRIQEAASKRSYQGTVVVSSGSTVASSRITHHCEGRDQFERIDSLDGQARHVVRQNEQVHTVWPQRRVAMVERRDQLSSFPGLLQAGGDRVPDYYELRSIGQERVAGREANVLMLRPKDQHRYGYRLWADKATGLLCAPRCSGSEAAYSSRPHFRMWRSACTRPSTHCYNRFENWTAFGCCSLSRWPLGSRTKAGAWRPKCQAFKWSAA